MSYVVIVHATFVSKSDAEHIYNQAKSVATNASVALLGQEGERTSHAYVAEETEPGVHVIDKAWHIDLFGIVREGREPDTSNTPEWIQPAGAHDSYPAQNVRGEVSQVTHNGEVWVNTHGNENTWEPGVFGWTREEDYEG